MSEQQMTAKEFLLDRLATLKSNYEKNEKPSKEETRRYNASVFMLDFVLGLVNMDARLTPTQRLYAGRRMGNIISNTQFTLAEIEEKAQGIATYFNTCRA